MKKTIKPSPAMIIVLGFVLVLCVGVMLLGIEMPEEFTILFIGVAVCFVYLLFTFFTRDKIEFDEETFTIGSKTYKFSDISKVEVEAGELMRGLPVLEFSVYVNDKRVLELSEGEKGTDEFIACVKKHGVTVSIDV